MFLGLFALFVALWALGFLTQHIFGGLIHLLLIIAFVSLIMHFFSGRTKA